MAAASPSPLVSSVEKTNGAKLCRLLIDGGTMVLRTIFDSYHPPANLLADLNVNYHTLNNLLRRRVLHKSQWDLLFPPGGAIPDSNTFDITLLFLLLTSICGLSPPPLGWHTKPLPSDTSVEANLARIKFFRNKFYGHVTTTGVDTPTFSVLWLELSAFLVALGLPQAEIDRLKAENCGEEDLIDVLFEWAESEEDIKSQLKDIRQSQSKVQQGVDEVHLTQLEERKILQSNKRKLDEMLEVQTEAQHTFDELRQSQTKTQQAVHETRQYQIKTQQTVDEVRQSQIKTEQTVDAVRQSQMKTQQTVDEVHQFQTKTQQTVDEVRQSQIKTQQTIDEVRQNQVEDRGTIQDSNTKLQEVFQMDRKTHQVVRNVRETQIDDSKAIQEICHTQHEFHKTLQETKSRVEDIQQTHEKLLGTQDEELEGQKEYLRENEILKKLAKIDTLKNVTKHRDTYVEGTRLSIFAKVETLLNHITQNRIGCACFKTFQSQKKEYESYYKNSIWLRS